MHDQDTGTLLRRLRLERGWTQRQAAELLGVSAQAVSKWERGQGCPDVGMLPRLAKIFGVSVEGILDWYVTFRHPMDKGHYIRFAACVTPDRLLLARLYPEQGSEFRIPQLRGGAKLYLCCSCHGLFQAKLP